MTPSAPFYEFGEHFAVDLDGARVVFTTRRGGFSSGPYESLNLGRLTADRPEDVRRNRAALKEQLGVQPAYIRQVHGTAVRRVVEPPVEPTDAVELPECDGQATAMHGVAPMFMTADCLPVAVAGAGAVAMLHAGWRGLADDESFMRGRATGTAATRAALQLTRRGVEDAVDDASGKTVASHRHRRQLVPQIARRIVRLGIAEDADHVAIQVFAA